MLVLLKLHAFGEPFNEFAELIGLLLMLSRHFTMFLVSSLTVMARRHLDLLECVQGISRLFHLIVNPSDALVDLIPQR